LKGKKGEAYNCASGLKISINDIAGKIKILAESDSNVIYEDWRAGDIKDFEVSNEKIKNLGFEFEYLNFDLGLKKTFDWYKNNNC